MNEDGTPAKDSPDIMRAYCLRATPAVGGAAMRLMEAPLVVFR